MVLYCNLTANVRLVDDIGNPVVENEGILQIYVVAPGSQTKEWRYVCDDYFDWNTNGPNIACKELGYRTGTQHDATVQGEWMYWHVSCIGSEKSLADCERPNAADCAPSEAVKLNCTGTQKCRWNFEIQVISASIFK